MQNKIELISQGNIGIIQKIDILEANDLKLEIKTKNIDGLSSLVNSYIQSNNECNNKQNLIQSKIAEELNNSIKTQRSKGEKICKVFIYQLIKRCMRNWLEKWSGFGMNLLT